MLTSREVIRSLAADFKRRDLSYADVSRLTGYSKQTIANIMSSQETYFCKNQALRFSHAFGYDKEYLMTGKGSLINDETPAGNTGDISPFSEDSKKLAIVMSMLSRYIFIADDPALLALYNNITKFINEKDRKKASLYLKDQEQLFDKISAENDTKLQ